MDWDLAVSRATHRNRISFTISRLITGFCDVQRSVTAQNLAETAPAEASPRLEREIAAFKNFSEQNPRDQTLNLGAQRDFTAETGACVARDSSTRGLKRFRNSFLHRYPHAFCILSSLGEEHVSSRDSHVISFASLMKALGEFLTRSSLRVCAQVLALALLAQSLGACQNGQRFLASKQSSTSNGDITDTVDGGGSRIFYINSVVRNQSDPTQFDLIGSNDKFSTWCVDTDPNNPGNSSCTCRYDYTTLDSNGATQTGSVDAPSTYHEANLLRCSGADIPADITSIAVSAVHVPTGQTSNAITFSLSFNGQSGDYSSLDSYVTVLRHQCTENLPIGLFLGANAANSGTDWNPANWTWSNGVIQDPFISKRKEFSFGYNYYTTNMGKTINSFVGLTDARPADATGSGGIRGYVCPFIDQDTFVNFGGSTGYDDQAAKVDYRFFRRADSQAGTGMVKIFPLTSKRNEFNEMSFKLARSPVGLFTQPVVGLAAPKIRTAPSPKPSYDAGEIPPMGFAISPSKASGAERCPVEGTEIQIPANHRFVKLWLARALIPKRTLQVSKKLTSDVGLFACNPGRWSGVEALNGDANYGKIVTPKDVNQQSVIKNCGATGSYSCKRSLEDGKINTVGTNSCPSAFITSSGGSLLADRVLLPLHPGNPPANLLDAASCYAMSPDTGMGSLVNTVSTTCSGNLAGCASRVTSMYPNGTDLVLGNQKFLGGTNAPGTCGSSWDFGGGTSTTDELNSCNNIYHNDTNFGAFADFGDSSLPSTHQRSFYNYKIDASDNEDFIYFVTPSSVTWSDLSDPDSAAAKKYLPSRTVKVGSCISSSDPDCSDNSNQINYGIVPNQIGEDSGNSSTRTFPLCVIQDTTEGASQ